MEYIEYTLQVCSHVTYGSTTFNVVQFSL